MSLLDKIISSIMTGFAIDYFIKNMSTEKYKDSKRIAFFILISFFLIFNSTVISNFTDSSLKMFINYFTIMLLLKLIYNQSNDESIVNSFIIMFLVTIGEMLFTIIIFLVKIDINKYMEFPLAITISSLFVLMIICLSVKIKKIKQIATFLKRLVRKNLILLLFMIMIGMDILLFNNSTSNFFSMEYFGNILLLVIFLLIIYLIFKEKFMSMKMTEKYDHMEENIKRYEQIINEQNKKSHEFKNQLAVINGYIDEKNVKAKEYIKTILIDANEVDAFFMKEIVKIPSGGLKGLLYYKIYDIKKKHLNFYLKVEGRMINLSNKLTAMQYKELTQVVGVLIDNAIQASEKSKGKIVDISIKSSRNKYSIRISNTYDKNFDYDKIGESGFTTKGKNRGYGLRLVKDIVEKNDIFSVEKKLNNDMFTQEFEITLNKK